MPIKKNALKALRQTKLRTARRAQIKKTLSMLLNETQCALSAPHADAVPALLKKAQKALDKASKNKLVSRNRANRIKSALYKKMRAALAA